MQTLKLILNEYLRFYNLSDNANSSKRLPKIFENYQITMTS